MTTRYNRRRTDAGYTPKGRSPLQALRSVLRMTTVSESLQALSHWRRLKAAGGK
ncbi:MAG TPA: hypothetical protein VNP72_07785 [Longimicrobium sp.]|nr:hypothetical protein [Longimicrobium sp.]